MIRLKCIAVLLGALTLAGLVGCGPRAAAPAGDVSTGPTSLPQASTQSPALGGTPVQPLFAEDASESVKLARQDLAQRLGVSVDSVTTAAVLGQEFSADAFYCRATKDRVPAEEPPAALTGFAILLQASGRRYEYHASGSTVVFCRSLP